MMGPFREEDNKTPYTFHEKLSLLLKYHGMTEVSDTPHWILAEYMMDCLRAYNKAIEAHEKFYRKKEYWCIGREISGHGEKKIELLSPYLVDESEVRGEKYTIIDPPSTGNHDRCRLVEKASHD